MYNDSLNDILKKSPEIARQLGFLGFLSGCGSPPEPKFEPLPDREVEDFGFEVLGIYESNEPAIIIDDKKCEKVANELGVLFKDLILVVLVHELAHFVTHRGLGHARNEWYKFSKSHLLEDQHSQKAEQTAQALTFLWLRKERKENKPKLMEAFERLSEKSPPQYREWENMKTMEFDQAWGDNTILLHKISGRIGKLSWEFGGADENTINHI